MVTEVVDKVSGDISYRYIKKSVIQKELLKIYEGHTRWEMLRETVTAKGMYGVGRFEYRHPVSKEWLSVTGTASLPHDKKMRLGFPSLEGHCLQNAVKKIGVFFGQTLNQSIEDKMPDETIDEDAPISQEDEQIQISLGIMTSKTEDELKGWRFPTYRKGQNVDLQTQYENKLRELKK
jgi:hypothetical protein